MSEVTGRYADIANLPLPVDTAPHLEFVPSGPATTVNGTLVSGREVTVTEFGADGSFSVDLSPTSNVFDPGFHYVVKGFYLDPDAYDTGKGMTRVDIFEFELYVPTEGGQIGDLVKRERPIFDWVIVSLTQPPVEIFGAIWMQVDPAGDPNLGSGDIYVGRP